MDDYPEHSVVIDRTPTEEILHEIQKCSTAEQAVKAVDLWLKNLKDGNSGSQWLTLHDFSRICRQDDRLKFAKVSVAPYLINESNPASPVMQSYREVADYVVQEKQIYGVNTGFGSFRTFSLSGSDVGTLSANILLSHATGVGRPLPVEVVRGVILLRLKTFCQGCSGVRPEIIRLLVEMLNKGIVPYIPEKGSVGSSGDLAPLAHLFQVAIGRGRGWVIGDGSGIDWSETSGRREEYFRSDEDRLSLWQNGNRCVLLEGEEIWKAVGIDHLDPNRLQAKDGLALTNGATVSAAILALGALDALNLYNTANVCGALTLQAVSGHTRAMEPLVQAIRPQSGQIYTGWEMLRLLQGSTLVNRCAYNNDAQDDYSIRAIPQVHGSAWNAIDHVRQIAEVEINSATDNPLFFKHIIGNRSGFAFPIPDDLFAGKNSSDSIGRTLDTTHCSAANFHGEPVAMALDYLKIAISELSSISERRIQLLLDSHHNRGLPGNLTLGAKGLHSGFMIFQYTAASLVSENKVLSHPSSVDSIPTSANVEDHVSMATNAARHLRMIEANVTNVLAIELLCALQAIDLRTTYLKEWLHRVMMKDKLEKKYTSLKEWVEKSGIGYGIGKMILDFTDEKDLASLQIEDVRGCHLKPSHPTEKIRDWVRNRLGIPFIYHDGIEGSHEPPIGIGGYATFASHQPGEMIAQAAKAIVSGKIAGIAG